MTPNVYVSLTRYRQIASRPPPKKIVYPFDHEADAAVYLDSAYPEMWAKIPDPELQAKSEILVYISSEQMRITAGPPKYRRVLCVINIGVRSFT